MKALMWTAPERMEFCEVEEPAILEGDVLLRVEAVGICGSEIEGYLGHNSLRVPPLVMGHEFCGIVERAGHQSQAKLIGQKAVVNPLLFCGKCPSCRKGLTNLCASRRIIGIHLPGAFAEYVAVPASAVVPVPERLNSFRAALAEPLACSLRAARRAMERHPFANVLVIGAGGIGLLCAMVAKLLGASLVMMADTNEMRLESASRCGVDYTFNPKNTALAEAVSSIAGEKGVDVVIDAAGFQSTRESALKIVNPGGTFMNIGLGVDDTSLRINHLIRNEIEILGSFCYTAQDFYESVQLLISGKIQEDGWTEIRSLRDGGAAFSDLVAGKVNSGKILLQTT
ncbi:alcohol dehydrogenase [Gordoniibacillus kamchatkensis]|uniref:Alcohol dehydrogenase n=1 Tax=Gordoniibacillus kamchatkensis TaxID=1590651 RepID=A0ABR5AH29_9BACL|nr:galactitol-1-phosphate 5-dehydrogenase [Paenibacillus sp. VKM B-2647]KIL40363.1 alcohol dehydrogenase [Paenibacillus sp. VKM B-2647]